MLVSIGAVWFRSSLSFVVFHNVILKYAMFFIRNYTIVFSHEGNQSNDIILPMFNLFKNAIQEATEHRSLSTNARVTKQGEKACGGGGWEEGEGGVYLPPQVVIFFFYFS